MRGASRTALADAVDALDGALGVAGDAALEAVSNDLLAASRLLSSDRQLARALTDPSVEAPARTALLERLFTGQVSPLALSALRAAVSARWSEVVDLADAVEILGAQAGFTLAERMDTLDEIEDELFRFARLVERAPELRSALTDPALPVTNKRDLVRALLTGKVAPLTAALVDTVVAAPRGRTTERALDQLAAQAAGRRNRSIAVVRSAVELTADQCERLATALGRTLGRAVRLQVEVDPAVLGGIVVRVGDELFDGSIARRLIQVRQGLTD